MILWVIRDGFWVCVEEEEEIHYVHTASKGLRGRICHNVVGCNLASLTLTISDTFRLVVLPLGVPSFAPVCYGLHGQTGSTRSPITSCPFQ